MLDSIPQETAAYGQLTQNAQTSPTGSFAANAQDLTNKYLTGDPTGLLGSSLSSYQNLSILLPMLLSTRETIQAFNPAL